MELIKTKINFNPKLSHDDIYSCIDSQILIFNGKITSSFFQESKENKSKLLDLYNNIKKVDNDLSYEEQNKTEMSFLFDGLVYDEFKKNRNITANLITYMTKLKKFYIIDYDPKNKEHNHFLTSCLTEYDPKSYYDGYESDLQNVSINEYINNKLLKKAFQIYLNEKVKDLLQRVKDRLRKLSNETKRNITKLTGQYKANTAEYEKFFYNFSTHIENMLQHAENKYIVIRIIFKHDKYNSLLTKLGIKKENNMISFLEQKNGVSAQSVVTRTLKYINDKLDPECKKF
jgi:hypothetical protein